MNLVQMNEERVETKAVSRSVTMPLALWDAVDAHANADRDAGDRSTYIRRLVTADLQAAGKLPGSPEAEALREARDVMQLIGAGPFRERLRTLVSTAAPAAS